MHSDERLHYPECLVVQLNDDDSGAPVPNIALGLDLYAASKNDYGFMPALSDCMGVVRMPRSWVENAIWETRNFFLMDYSSTIEQCRPYVDLKVMTPEEVSAAIAARNLYGETPKMGVEPSVSQLANARNGDYEPQVVRLVLDVPGVTLREVAIRLRRRQSPA